MRRFSWVMLPISILFIAAGLCLPSTGAQAGGGAVAPIWQCMEIKDLGPEEVSLETSLKAALLAQEMTGFYFECNAQDRLVLPLEGMDHRVRTFVCKCEDDG